MSDFWLAACLGAVWLLCAFGPYLLHVRTDRYRQITVVPPAPVPTIRLTEDDHLVTFAQVASGMSPELVTAISSGMPCAGGYGHLWDSEDGPFSIDIGVQRIGPHWTCVYCGTIAMTDPRSDEERRRPLVSAHLEEFL